MTGRARLAQETGALAVDALLAVFGSGLTLEDTFAVSGTVVSVVLDGSEYVIWNVAVAPEASAAIEHVVVPVPPLAGLWHVNTGPEF